MLPVVRIAGGGEEVVGLPLRVDERSGPHRDQGARSAGGGLLDHRLTHHVADLGGESGGEGGVGAGEREDHGQRVRGGHRRHLAEGDIRQGRGGQSGEVGLDHGGGEGRAVVEGDAGPEGHGPHVVGGVGGHGAGQEGPDAAIGRHRHQGVEDGVGVEESVVVPMVGGRVEPVDLRGGGDGEGTPPYRASRPDPGLSAGRRGGGGSPVGGGAPRQKRGGSGPQGQRTAGGDPTGQEGATVETVPHCHRPPPTVCHVEKLVLARPMLSVT